MIRRHAILIAGVVLTAVAGVLHTVSGNTAGTIAASLPLLLVAPHARATLTVRLKGQTVSEPFVAMTRKAGAGQCE